MSPRLQDALDIAHKAGRLTLGLFQVGTDVEFKGDDTPVTAADRGAEELIRRELASRYPGETVLGEEQGLDGASDDRWVIDPIDGTKSFIAGVPLYATLLSYEQAGEPILGVCVLPALNEVVYAEQGGGAYWNGRRAHVSTESDLDRAKIACGGHRSMAKYGRTDGIERLAERAVLTRTWCDAYGHALVATGRVDAMIDPVVSRWDISAMAIIVREAGGVFTDFDGNKALASEAISTTPAMHAQVLAAFSS